MHLIVEQRASFISKHQGRLRVSQNKQPVTEVPLLHLEQLIITASGISISSDAVKACVEQGIPVHFLDGTGQAYASLYAAGLTGTVQTRRSQLAAETDQRSLLLVKAFSTGKLQNQINLLRYLVKNHRANQPELATQVDNCLNSITDELLALENLKGTTAADLRPTILAHEGRAAHHYWSAIRHLLRADLDWPGRQTQGATDPFNAALNYGYGILYSQVERSLVLAGLDPYGGFLHVDRPGKPSLVLDLIEEFRQAVVDRPIIGLINRKLAIEQEEDGRLTLQTRHDLAERILQRLESPQLYEGKRQALRIILQQQARHLATFLRQDRPTYTPFVMPW
jgi:CRISPR-associated protein Cas1